MVFSSALCFCAPLLCFPPLLTSGPPLGVLLAPTHVPHVHVHVHVPHALPCSVLARCASVLQRLVLPRKNRPQALECTRSAGAVVLCVCAASLSTAA